MLDKTQRDISHVNIARDVQFDLYRENWGADENYIYEPEIIYAITKLVRPGDVCIDAGASLGYHSLIMSRMAGQTGQVVAFEPDPNYYRKTADNFALNDAANIKLLPFALWDGIGMIPFHVIDTEKADKKYAGLSSVIHYHYPPSTGIEVQAAPLDSMIDPDAHVRMLKIDCEGSEEKILHGAEQLLRRGIDFVIVEFNYKIMPIVNSSDRSMRDYMFALGYDCFFLHRDGQPPTFIDNAVTITMGGDRFHINVLFAKRALVEECWHA